MNEQQLKIATMAIDLLAEVSGADVNDILEVLKGNIISDEDCYRIRVNLLGS